MQSAKFYINVSILILLASANVLGQRTCGTVEYMNQLKNVESKTVFENWILQKQLETPTSGQEEYSVDEVTIYQIPVVVHIVHNGEAAGSGSNISDAQIHSQLEVLNEDFRKLNADSVNIPAEFKSLYSDIGFEFILAKRNPNNQATTGITRTEGSQSSWSISQNETLKLHDYWPSEDYLNIWVTTLSGGWLGWAQYPESSSLSGLEPPYNASTDGVVITYNAFGSIAKDPTANLQSRFNLGRTSTHEIGHFFGLRHIWGDGGCGVDDYVTDTPIADSEYYNCPSLGGTSTTCGTQDMFMNYMDYVDDNCMNIFSLGQKERMVIVIENSPRRISLTNSLGLIPPNCEDLAITKFITPGAGICDNEVATTIEIKNQGICFINETNVSLFINNIEVANKDFDIDLAVNQSTYVTFETTELLVFGNLEFKAIINTVNNNLDGFEDDNTLIFTSLRAESVTKLHENFSSPNPQWTVRTDKEVSSLVKDQSVFYSITNTAAIFNYYNGVESADSYVSPKLSLGAAPSTLLFDYAYGYKYLFNDELTVLISTDCGNNFSDVLFSSMGENLATTTNPVAFYPSGAKDWQHIQIDISQYANQDIIFSFTGKSAGGNQILFDNIQVVDNSYNDIALVGLSSPSILCNSQNEASIWVENKGTQILEELNLSTQLATTISTVSYPQLNLLPGERAELSLPIATINATAALKVSLIDEDDDVSNDSFTQSVIPNGAAQNVPLREQFNSGEISNNWAITGTGTDQMQGWALANNRLEFIAANSPAKGLKEMIVLPPLNLSDLQSASMHFNFAYAYNGFNEELLRVKASTNCGETYQTLLEQGGEELATHFVSTPWEPNGEADWKNMYVDLSEFAGSEQVHIVIEITSAQGNNAFVNNIELYASNIEEPLQLGENTITAYPNPSTNGIVNISFNLENSQPAKLYIYNAQGSFVLTEDVTTALNQTFEIQTVNFRNGMYFVRLVGNKIDISRSFIVSH